MTGIRNRNILAALLALALVYAFLVWVLIDNKSATTDEVGFHLVNGYAYIKTGDYRMSPAMPPLIRQWLVLPWLAVNPDLNLDSAAWREADSVPFALEFFYSQQVRHAAYFLYSSRVMSGLLGLLLGWVVIHWAARLYGWRSGLFAGLLYVFTPAVLAYSALATVEMGITLFYVLTVYSLWVYLSKEKPALKSCALIGLALGAALASKLTSLMLVPVIGIALVLKKGWWRGSLAAAGVFTLSLAVVWASYGFEVKPLLENVPRIEEKEHYLKVLVSWIPFLNLSPEPFIEFAHTQPVPLATWWLGFAGIVRSHHASYRHFFMGEWIDHAIWYNYLVIFGIKTTLGFFCLLILRALQRLREGARLHAAEALIAASTGLLFAATLNDTTGAGLRYLLPVYPLWIIAVSGLFAQSASLDGKSRRVVGAWGCLFAAAHIASSLGQFPNSLQYFNEAIGGPRNAWKYVRANDLEWGQELKNLSRWCRDQKVTDMRYLLFGTYDASYYGLPGQKADETDFKEPRRAFYAISIFYLDAFEWARPEEASGSIGDVIYLFDRRGLAG